MSQKKGMSIETSISGTHVIIRGIDPASELLTIEYKLAQGGFTLHPIQEENTLKTETQPFDLSSIYNVLKSCGKNLYKNTPIIEKKTQDNKGEIQEIYIFNFGLQVLADKIKILGNKEVFVPKFKGSQTFFGNKIFANSQGKREYKSIFRQKVILNLNFADRVYCANCEFYDEVSLRFLKDSNFPLEMHNGADFSNCQFHKDVDFANFVSGTIDVNNPLKDNAQNTKFKNCIFYGNADFTNARFFNDVFFSNTQFKACAKFSESIFAKNASFYNVSFAKMPNFSQAIFKGNLNVVNSSLNFDFNKTKQDIQEALTENALKWKIANDFRDSFRLFKNALAKESNTLDASNFQRIELYCKEIELDSKQPKCFSKDWIDKWQLCFYRHTSDHHTDLLRTWNSLLCLVFVFGVMSFGAMSWFAFYWDKSFPLDSSSLLHLRVFYDTHIKLLIYKHPYRIFWISWVDCWLFQPTLSL